MTTPDIQTCAAMVRAKGQYVGRPPMEPCGAPVAAIGPCVKCGHGGGEDDEHGVGIGIPQTFCADCIEGQDDNRVYPDAAYHDYEGKWVHVEVRGVCGCSHDAGNHLEFIGQCGGDFLSGAACECQGYAPTIIVVPSNHEAVGG